MPPSSSKLLPGVPRIRTKCLSPCTYFFTGRLRREQNSRDLARPIPAVPLRIRTSLLHRHPQLNIHSSQAPTERGISTLPWQAFIADLRDRQRLC